MLPRCGLRSWVEEVYVCRGVENVKIGDRMIISLSVKPVGSEPSVFTPTLWFVWVFEWAANLWLSKPLLHLTCVVRLALDVNNLQLNNRFTYLFSSNDDTSSPLLNLWLVSFLCSLKRVVLHMNDAVPWVICQRLLYSLSFRPNLYITVQTEDFCFPDKSVKSLHFLHKVRTVSITTLIN